MSDASSDPLPHFVQSVQSGLDVCSVANTRLLVAVSGGPDSVALLCALIELRDSVGLQLVVGHVNHHLRGEESDADEQWVERLAAQFDLPCCVTRPIEYSGDVRNVSEEAARNVRYGLLRQAAKEAACPYVAVAHTSDDQAETILHHLLRGTGLSGLRGIPQTRMLNDWITLVRPMLGVSRSDVEEWLTAIKQSARTDRTNRETKFTRNRIRHQLLPELESEFNPQIRRVLQSLATQASELTEFIDGQVDVVLNGVTVVAAPDALRIGCESFDGLSLVLVRETLRRIWREQQWPMQRMGFREWQRLAQIAVNGGAESLPGQIDARRRGTLLVLTRRSAGVS